jgi:hypothetical protein
MRKTRTALQADERLLHASSCSLSFYLTVYQPVRLAADGVTLSRRQGRLMSSRAGYVLHSMLMPQMWSGWPKYVPLGAHDRRRGTNKLRLYSRGYHL